MTLGLLLLTVSSIPSVALSQEGLSLAELMKLPGKLLGKGNNTQPVGPLEVVSYRVEELSLPQTMKVELHGEKVEVDRAWRVTVTGGPFQARTSPPVIWIDDHNLGNGMENEELTEITVITFDRALLREGGTIALSYGEEKGDRVQLPERLKLSDASQGEGR